jgi:hypothetical protein
MLRTTLVISATLLLSGCCSTLLDANFNNDVVGQPPATSLGANSLELPADTESARVIETLAQKELRYGCPSGEGSRFLRFAHPASLSRDKVTAAWDGRLAGFAEQSTTLRIRLKDRQGDAGRIAAEVLLSGAGDNQVNVRPAGGSERSVRILDASRLRLLVSHNRTTNMYKFSINEGSRELYSASAAAPDGASVDFGSGATLEFFFDEGCGDGAEHIIDNLHMQECND